MHLLSVADKYIDQKQLEEEQGLSQLILSGHSPLLREVRAGTQTETMEEYCLLT